MNTQAYPSEVLKKFLAENEDAQQKVNGVQMILSTIGRRGYPSSRVVRLRDVTEKGLVFYTFYNSNKSLELEKNPKTSAVVYFPQNSNMIRIQGNAEKLSDQENDIIYDQLPERFKEMFANSYEKPGQQIDFDKYIEDMAKLEVEQKENKSPKIYKRPAETGGWVIKPNYILFYEPLDIPEAKGMRKVVEYKLNEETNTWNSAIVTP
mmetsp:Transcript_78665/g.91975  ORF Transcript_78665/g.91975 Transcript_78665/m.91975 type:complete len:207 (+) Transcript_78665:16-636(+)|eukprot:CAMPEP_0176475134 /NCGR_PEP_ID=MMETSP0127-20121128/43432_1 /TAXON_ID=938130 /ORGANISM="Platyophrya macrostoma, Strain WH" /LENGTH=206 /DNA_ID=CAMNT_0017870685 /DNA_START=15 /DNA_END=635 /DNA_ORIENTATION=+